MNIRVAYYTVIARCICRSDTVMPDIFERVILALKRHV